MATEAQIEANRRNSQNSTGPRSESGKSASSKNHLKLGLFTFEDYVKPGEAEIYKEFCQSMCNQLSPANILEDTFVSEITGASWRLRRCAAAESDLADYREQDPLLDESTDKTRRSIERARAASHGVIQRSLNQLRKIQTERIIRENLNYGGKNQNLAADCLKLVDAQRADDKVKERAAQQQSNNTDLGNAGDLVAGSSSASPELASNCKTTAPIARNAQCPCKSGEKYKRCCARSGAGWPTLSPQAARSQASPLVDAPPVLGKAA